MGLPSVGWLVALWVCLMVDTLVAMKDVQTDAEMVAYWDCKWDYMMAEKLVLKLVDMKALMKVGALAVQMAVKLDLPKVESLVAWRVVLMVAMSVYR